MKIISGCQTGADRAAIDAAIAQGLDWGGAVPKGMLAEDGTIDDKYDRLTELSSSDYRKRTEKNVLDADGTIIFSIGKPTGGSALTIKYAQKHGRPVLAVDLNAMDNETAARTIRDWLNEINPSVLNVAGPRESKQPGIYQSVYDALSLLLAKNSKFD